MDLPGQSKVRGIDTEDLGDNVKKRRSSILHMRILKDVCTIFLQQQMFAYTLPCKEIFVLALP